MTPDGHAILLMSIYGIVILSVTYITVTKSYKYIKVKLRRSKFKLIQGGKIERGPYQK